MAIFNNTIGWKLNRRFYNYFENILACMKTFSKLYFLPNCYQIQICLCNSLDLYCWKNKMGENAILTFYKQINCFVGIINISANLIPWRTRVVSCILETTGVYCQNRLSILYIAFQIPYKCTTKGMFPQVKTIHWQFSWSGAWYI